MCYRFMKRAKTNYISYILRLISLLILISPIFFIISTSVTILKFELIPIIIFVFLFLIVLLVGLNIYQEPNFLAIKGERLLLGYFPLIYSKSFDKVDVIGFSKSKKTYLKGVGLSSISFPIYILYLKSGRKIHFIDYNFKQMWEISKLLKSIGIKFLGEEDEKYRFHLIRSYKF